MLKHYIMICPASNSSLISERWLKSRSRNLQWDRYNSVNALLVNELSPNTLSMMHPGLCQRQRKYKCEYNAPIYPTPVLSLFFPLSIARYNAYDGMHTSACWNLHGNLHDEFPMMEYDRIRTIESAWWDPHEEISAKEFARWNPHNEVRITDLHNRVCTSIINLYNVFFYFGYSIIRYYLYFF